jgi:type I restriction enzyme R subunit
VKASAAALSDPRTACFHARWTIEQAIRWAFTHDPSLPTTYDKRVSALLHDPEFMALLSFQS